MADKLSDVLESYKAATLASIMAFNGLAVQDQKTKARSVQVLVNHFGGRSHIQQAYRDLSPAEHEVVDTLMRHHGRVSTFTLEQRLSARKLIDAPKVMRNQPNVSPPDYRQANPRLIGQVMARLLEMYFRGQSPQ